MRSRTRRSACRRCTPGASPGRPRNRRDRSGRRDGGPRRSTTPARGRAARREWRAASEQLLRPHYLLHEVQAHGVERLGRLLHVALDLLQREGVGRAVEPVGARRTSRGSRSREPWPLSCQSGRSGRVSLFNLASRCRASPFAAAARLRRTAPGRHAVRWARTAFSIGPASESTLAAEAPAETAGAGRRSGRRSRSGRPERVLALSGRGVW